METLRSVLVDPIKRLIKLLKSDLSKSCNRDLCLNVGGVPIMWDKRGYLVIAGS